MDDFGKLKSPYNLWHDCRFLFTSWPPMHFMYPEGLLVGDEHEPRLIKMQDMRMNFYV